MTVYAEYPDVSPVSGLNCADVTVTVSTLYRAFSVAPSSSTNFGASASSESSFPTALPYGSSSRSISKGAIAGAVVGSVAGAALLLILGFLFLRRRSRSRPLPVAPPVAVAAVRHDDEFPPPAPPQYSIYKKHATPFVPRDDDFEKKAAESLRPQDCSDQKEYELDKKGADWVDADAWNKPEASSSAGATRLPMKKGW
jgi:hypothetical protein